MTTILAVTDGHRAWIGSDTRIGNEDRFFDSGGPKWIVSDKRDWAMGVAGYPGEQQALAGYVDVLRGCSDFDLPTEIRACLSERGWTPKRAGDGGLPHGGSTFIIATPCRVIMLGVDFTIIPIDTGVLAADGSGHEYALGAWHALTAGAPGVETAERVNTCLATAMALDPYSGGKAWTEVLT